MTIVSHIRTHWFFLALPPLLLIEHAFARSTDWNRAGAGEMAILFDLCLFIPALYWLCYHRRLATRVLLIRTGALFCAGIYVASLLVPAEGEVLIGHLTPLRWIGPAVLALIELKLLFISVRLAFSGRSSAADVAERTGALEWIARLMLLEARSGKPSGR